MPSRPFLAVIVLFWLGMTGWLIRVDVWPLIRPGEPPPYTIDLADEVLTGAADTRWKLLIDDKDKGYALTSVRYRADSDTYELNSEIKLWYHVERTGGNPSDIILKSMYRVSRDGELRELQTSASGKVTLLGLATISWDGELKGEVHNNLFVPHVELKSALADGEWTLDPVPVSARGSVFNPLQPVNRINGLKRGQRWHLPRVDPLDELFYHVGDQLADKSHLPNPFSRPRAKILQAEVLPDLQFLAGSEGKPDVACLVIEYRGEDVTARTWVRESDGLVVKQESTDHQTRLVLIREHYE